jgi:hypothetical protein
LAVTPDDSAEAIRRRMAELRRELASDVRDVRQSARDMANPLYYIRRFPWASAAIAAGIGYLLVPKKKEFIKPDPEMLVELLKKHQINFDPAKAASDSHGMLKSLAVMGLTWAARTGLAYIGQQLAAAATQQNQDGDEARTAMDESHPPEPSPIEEPWNMTG